MHMCVCKGMLIQLEETSRESIPSKRGFHGTGESVFKKRGLQGTEESISSKRGLQGTEKSISSLRGFFSLFGFK